MSRDPDFDKDRERAIAEAKADALMRALRVQKARYLEVERPPSVFVSRGDQTLAEALAHFLPSYEAPNRPWTYGEAAPWGWEPPTFMGSPITTQMTPGLRMLTESRQVRRARERAMRKRRHP